MANTEQTNKMESDLSPEHGRTTVMDAIMKIAGGNPGSLNVCMGLIQDGDHGCLSTLMNIGLEGSDLYCLFNDKIATGDIDDLKRFLCIVMLGMISHDRVRELAKDQTRSINFTPEEKELFLNAF